MLVVLIVPSPQIKLGVVQPELDDEDEELLEEEQIILGQPRHPLERIVGSVVQPCDGDSNGHFNGGHFIPEEEPELEDEPFEGSSIAK